MERLKMQSRDVIGSNIQKIAQLFPQCVTEHLGKDGKPQLGIDFEKLQAELSNDIIAEGEERYQFTWPDKRAAARLANTPTTMTLRPCRAESVDFDHTQNLYIEGDNLDVLKVLRETYLGKVKMIYIDPPYNTGNDFVYNDDFVESYDEFAESCKVRDGEGNLQFNPKANGESNGRFHTDWLNMMYPRLKVARDLLTDDGVIFISIDDNEQKNLKNICDELFGGGNFIAQVIWERAFAPISLKKHFSNSHDYIFVYGKNIEGTYCNGLPRTYENTARYSNPDNDPRGPWQSDNTTVGPVVNSKVYPLTLPSGRTILPPSGRCWLYTQSRFQEMIDDNRIWFGTNGDNVPRLKRFLSEVKQGITPMSIWKHEEVGHSQSASQALKTLFGEKSYFEYPKPVDLIQRCLSLYSNSNSIILDFFSGSATTAHAVMQLNAEDGGNRKFIMVQLPELTDEKSEAYKAGYKNICEIGKERIRRAGKKIKADSPLTTQNLDVGFRVLKLDSSNMEDVYYTPEEFNSQMLFQENVKADRTEEDLLFQVMLELGIELSASIRKERLGAQATTVFNVDEGYLMATFAQNIDEATVIEIAKRNPGYFVMRDASAASDNVMDNFEQLFRHYSPETSCRII